MFDRLTGLPWLRIALVALLAASLAGSIWLHGANHVQAEWDIAEQQASAQDANIRAAKSQNNVRIITKFVDRIVKVREVAAHNEKEVQNHVDKTADAACTVPVGFVRLHDAAAAGRASSPAGPSDEAPAGVALSAVAAVISINYARSIENAEQLTALQEYVQANCTP